MSSSSSDNDEESFDSSSSEDSLAFSDIVKIRKIDTSSKFKRNEVEQPVNIQKKKRTKSEPPELSAKFPVGHFKAKIDNSKKKTQTRDPRFDNISGEFDPLLFRRSYSFVNDIREKEIDKLKKSIKIEKNDEERERLRKALNILQNKIALDKKEDNIQKIKSNHRKEQIERVKEGKTPYFLTRGQLNKLSNESNSKKNQKKRKRGGRSGHEKMPWKQRNNAD